MFLQYVVWLNDIDSVEQLFNFSFRALRAILFDAVHVSAVNSISMIRSTLSFMDRRQTTDSTRTVDRSVPLFPGILDLAALKRR